MKPHPRKGGCKGYDIFFRLQQIAAFDANQPIVVSIASIYRWKDDYRPKPNNHRHRDAVISGEYEELMKLYRLVYPTATLWEISNFILHHARIPRLIHHP